MFTKLWSGDVNILSLSLTLRWIIVLVYTMEVMFMFPPLLIFWEFPLQFMKHNTPPFWFCSEVNRSSTNCVAILQICNKMQYSLLWYYTCTTSTCSHQYWAIICTLSLWSDRVKMHWIWWKTWGYLTCNFFFQQVKTSCCLVFCTAILWLVPKGGL